MSEIEKMYENAGIKPLPTCKNCNMLDEYWSNGTYCSTCKCDKDNDECNIANYIYPPFTAEKQFFILKFFADNKIGEERPIIQFHWDDIDEQYYFYLQIPPDCYHAHDKDYDIALAKVVNLIWTKLTPEQQQQVKGILE